MNEFLEESEGGGQLMMEVLIFCHEYGVKAIDSFEPKMIIFQLLYGSFKIMWDKCVNIFEFPKKLEKTLMTNFPDGDLNTAQIKYNFT